MVQKREQKPIDKLLKAYQAYYDINKETPTPPFVAEASFQTNDEAYFLIKSARIGESQSKEFVFFAEEEVLDEERLEELDEVAWETGISRVKPHANHRNTDITMIVMADRVTDGAKKKAKGLSHYKNYKFGFQGWSHYKLVVLELSSGKAIYNRQGRELKKLFDNIIKTLN